MESNNQLINCICRFLINALVNRYNTAEDLRNFCLILMYPIYVHNVNGMKLNLNVNSYVPVQLQSSFLNLYKYCVFDEKHFEELIIYELVQLNTKITTLIS